MAKSLWDWIAQKFTPPKSKDVWTAATKGSTGGWAKPFAKPATLLPTAAALASIPVTGGLSGAFLPQLAALGATGGLIGGVQGATTGLWGEPGAGSALKGAVAGAGQGALVSGGAQGVGKIAQSFTPNMPIGWDVTKGVMPSTYKYNPTMLNSWASGFGGGLTSGSLTSPTSSGITSAFNPYTQAITQTATQAGTQAAKQGIDWGQVAGGVGVAALPSMFSEKTQIPQSSIYGDMTSKLLGGKQLSAIGQQGVDALSSSLSKEFQATPDEYYKSATNELDKTYQKALDNLSVQFQGVNPGSNIEGNSAFRKAQNELTNNWMRDRAAIVTDLNYRRENQYYDQRYKDIQSALGVDQNTMSNYLSLAQLDAENLALNTGISLGEAEQFKKIFGDLGSALMQRGIGLNDPMSAIKNLQMAFGG